MDIYSLAKAIKAFVFDVDGVMTTGALLLTDEGKYLRSFNIRDGYALKKALEAGFKIIVISGGISAGVEMRLRHLGLEAIFMNVNLKEPILMHWMLEQHIQPDQLAYMGDDILDIAGMQHAFIKACPADAVQEVKSISNFYSSKKGGEGCVRDLIELVLKVQNKW